MKPNKEYNGRSRIRMFNCDCMELMEDCDKYDLAIVDPPYGIGESMKKRENRSDRWKNPYKKNHMIKDWDNKPPDECYFKVLFDSSFNQILWGANHYISKTPYDSSCWLVWDKKNGNSDFSDCELAWTSFDSGVRKFEWLWNGFQKQRPEKRIHPTQKPVALYKWLLTNYAKEGDTILDTHGGSMSIAIACWDLGFDLDIIELDPDYFNDAVKRFERHISQTQLF